MRKEESGGNLAGMCALEIYNHHVAYVSARSNFKRVVFIFIFYCQRCPDQPSNIVYIVLAIEAELTER